MLRHIDKVESPRPQEEVFDYMAEFSNAAEWDPGTVSARRLDDGPIGKGSRFELIVRFAGRESPFVYEITEYDRPRRVVLRAETDAATVTDRMSVAPAAASGSILTYDARLELKGARKAMTPLMAILFGRVFRAGKRGLEAAIGRDARLTGQSTSRSG
jgi:hypothetical protein